MAPSNPSNRPTVNISADIQPSDFQAIGDVYVAAFKKTEILDSIFPASKAPSHEKQVELNVAERTARYAKPMADLLELKATIPSDPSDPTSEPKIVGFAIWLRPVDRTSTGGKPLPEEETADKKDGEKEEWEKEMDATKDLHFYGLFGEEMGRIRREWSKGARHWYLSYLVVHPDYQGLGIGGALLKYGTDRADAENISTWLESTIAGRPVYEAKGFTVQDWCQVPGDWPGADADGVLRWPGMERKPRSAATVAV